ncbi:tRNA lysidine(34) synthetase TilS [[Mycoplasma] falconis]|uniref:tRNA(Ile)-lysidine synthase n=1 Tax=[Mycoplasma] falconis TaxID=92403 RepID=A0A501XBG8_9BACT|nr:tRNA lysidine(34) synthetase TilS [[Mycoplasma] falconis]TPE57703.1 tRNA lysidine(34) synthetase TilS [[Mycoplasma] falconis]
MNNNYQDLKNKVLNKDYFLNKNEGFILAVSGGPDSVFLLDLLKDFNIVVCHVNYHFRYDSQYDQNLVESYCLENNIRLEILDLKDQKPQGNIENWAREKRYDFFKQVAKKYNFKNIVLAHHKDDFLETALMQKEAKRNPLFFGIKEVRKEENFIFLRPFIDLIYKNQIIDLCNEKSLLFATDYTNLQTNKYTRNKIRFEISKLEEKDKNDLYEEFLQINKNNDFKNTTIKEIYYQWKQNEFDCDFIKNQGEFINNLIFKLIHDNFKNVKLSSYKIENIKQFLFSNNRTAKYKLNNQCFLNKVKNKLIF